MSSEPANVLVVDDEINIIHSLEDMLEDRYRVSGATNGEAALDLLREQEFSVILSDQRMPTMPGVQFLEQASELSAATRIMMTGYADLDAVSDAVNLGQIYAYVAKPWDREPLRELIGRAAERYRLMQQLQTERDLLHALMSNIPDAVYFKDQFLRYIAANDASARLHGGVSPAAMIGRRADEIDSSELLDRIAGYEERVLAGAGPIVDTTISSGAGGADERWYSVTNVPLATDDGACNGVVTVAKDVTDRHIAELQLRESRERFRAVLDGTPASIYLNDVDGSYVMVNRRFAETFGVDIAMISGKSAADVFSPEVSCEIVALQNEVLKRRTQVSRELSMPDATGAMRNYYVSQVPITGHDGSINGICAIQADVTDQRKLEDHVRQSQKLESIGQLTGGISHDFNNLLTIIMGNLDIGLRAAEHGSMIHECMGTAKKAAVRGQALTRQLLVFARKQDLVPEIVSLDEVFAELGILAGRTLGRTIDFRLSANDTWPVRVDPSQLETALLNLCINARDAMPDGGSLTIEAANVDFAAVEAVLPPGLRRAQYVGIEIRDSGKGIVPDDIEQIFEPFFTTKEKGKGTGLGLSMVHGFVHQSEGTIQVHSEPGAGTTFTIYLPAAVDAVPSARGNVAGIRHFSAEGRSVLVVEDDEDVRAMVAAMLRSFGFSVREANCASDALSAFEDMAAVDLLYTDVLMPGDMNGLELANHLRESYPALPVILTSGFTANVLQESEPLPDGYAFLMKPYTEDKVIDALDHVLAPSSR